MGKNELSKEQGEMEFMEFPEIPAEELEELSVNRVWKSRIFEMLFSDKAELLKLYNAVNGTDYGNPDDLEINTLKNAIYMSMHNDVSFILSSMLNLYEHQSTYNPNLPLRFLMYVSDLYSALTKDENLYGSRLIEIPTPEFLVFYNGLEERPDKQVLKLSNAYKVKKEKVSLELRVTVYNINKGHNRKLLRTCRTLGDYAEYTYRVRTYAGTMNLEAAVERAINDCIQEGILSEFLEKNRAEAKRVSIYEYNEEKHMRQVREEGREEGKEEGKEEGRTEGQKIERERINKLNRKLLEDGRDEDLRRAVMDIEYQNALLEEYDL